MPSACSEGRGRRQGYKVVSGTLAAVEAGGAVWKEGAVCELSVLYPPSLTDAGQVPALLSGRGGLQVVLFFPPLIDFTP